MTKLTRAQTVEREEAIARVKEWLEAAPKGRDDRPVLFTALRSVSASGMSRVIACYIQGTHNDGTARMIDATWSIGKILGYRVKSTRCGEGLSVSGCGMDMGFHVTYNLGRYLYPQGFAVKGIGRNGDTSGHDNDGGYAITNNWL